MFLDMVYCIYIRQRSFLENKEGECAGRNDNMARKDSKGRNLKVGESQRKDGLYMYRYTDGKTGKRVTIYDTDLAGLREKERAIARELDDDILTDRTVKKLTVNGLFERYLEVRKLAERTRRNYVSMWNNRVKEEIGQMKVVQVRPSHIRLFYAKLTAEGYSHSTIKLLHTLLYPSFEMAIEDDIIRKNPAKNALGDNGKAPKIKEALTLSQQKRLLAFVEQNRIYNVYLPMLHIMIGTGLRCGELIGLTWEDIDMKNKSISIEKQLIYADYGDGYKLHRVPPKTDAGIRTIPMSEVVYKAFEKQKRLNFMQGTSRNVEIDGLTDFIFMSKNGRPIMPNALNHVLLNIRNAYNRQEMEAAKKEKRDAELMPTMSAHTMRHTSCTRMIESGMDLKVVQYIMGHSDISITLDVYNHITEWARIESEITKINMVQVV